MDKYIFLALLFFMTSAEAAVVEFVPPNDTTGSVYSTGTNSAWSIGRGVVFQATANQTIDSIGLYHDLTGISLSYKLSQTTSASDNIVAGESILASGSTTVTTNGLEWIDFSLPDTDLVAGNYYHIEFSFSGNGNQNFFYDNDNVTFSQGDFDVIDGSSGGNTSNSVMPAIRLNSSEAAETVETAAAPVPALPLWALWVLACAVSLFGTRIVRKAHLD